METLGLLSKVSTGAIQVVQNVSAIPSDVHPRNKLNGEFVGILQHLSYVRLLCAWALHGHLHQHL